MRLIRLTEENMHEYIGYNILYKSCHKLNLSIFKAINKSGKTIVIDNPALNNNLSLDRLIYVILPI
jgi:hypothetical protein